MGVASIIYTVVDESGDEGTTEVNVPDSFSLAQFTEFGAAMATLLDAILAGRVTGADLCFNADISGLTNNAPAEFSDVEQVGEFVFVTADQTKVICNIPALDENTVTIVGSDDIDQSQADVAAFITAMITGIAVTGGTIAPSDIGESDITTLRTARERHRSSGKRAS